MEQQKHNIIQESIAIAFMIASILACIGLWLLTNLPINQRRAAAEYVLTTAKIGIAALTAILIIGAVAGLLFLFWTLYNRGLIWHSSARIQQAEATRLAREAHLTVTVAPPGHQIIVSEVAGLGITHKPLHLAAGKVNGAPVIHTEEERRAWVMWNLSHSTSRKPEIATEEMPQIQAPLPDHVFLEHYILGQPSLRNLFLGMGRFPDGQVRPVSAPLAELVNIAVGGSSGFGKSVCMQSLAYQVINAKENPRPVLLDAQGVTFTQWAGDERLLWPLASKPADIFTILFELFKEMERRQQLFSHWRGVDRLDRYNAAVNEAERLAMIPIFFDEFGLLADHKDIAKYSEKLSQGGRKVGMPLISAAQTWYSNQISSALRANLSTSIQFYARSKSQSRVLIEDSAAVELLRKGQAWARLPGQPGLIEMQAPDISNLVDVVPTLIEGEAILPTVNTTEDDITERVLELFDSGIETLTSICRQVYGYKNQVKLESIKAILIEHGRLG